MYKFVNDKEFLAKSKSYCTNIMIKLEKIIKDDYLIDTRFYIIGSGAKNLITENGDEGIDFDFNIEILKCSDDDYDAKNIKEKVRKSFNKALKGSSFTDCSDSTSSLSTNKIRFINSNKWTCFKMDVGIIIEWDDETISRLIHIKTGNSKTDVWKWETATRSLTKIKEKIVKLKQTPGEWNNLRKIYLEKKLIFNT